jgi:hypothetical protein
MIINYDHIVVIYDHKVMLQTEMYLTIVINNRKTFIVKATGYLVKVACSVIK